MSLRRKWWVRRLVELGLALILAAGVIATAERAQQAYRHTIPASAWLLLNEVYVPDHVTGEDPEIIYDREVIEWFLGFWIVDVQRKLPEGLWAIACSGHGTGEYEPNEVIENDRVSLSWLLGHECFLRPGTYRLKITWTLSRPGWGPKSIFYTTPEFNVLENPA